MKDFKKFENFQNYLDSISDAASQIYSFRVGVFDNNRLSFHGSGNFFNDFFPSEAPIKPGKVDTPVGVMTHRALTVDSAYFYESVKDFPRQGDLFKSSPEFPKGIGAPSFWMLGSQTCTTANDGQSVVLPGYLKEDLVLVLKTMMDFKPEPSVYFREVISQNKVPRFLPIPAKDGVSESLIAVDLCQIYTVESAWLKEKTPVGSLSFSGLSYFQNRLAITLFRDVKNWTDKRQFR